MTPRVTNPFKSAPEGIKAMMALEAALKIESVGHNLTELVKLRASQINGCAYCIHMHATDLRAHGESEMRLYMLSAWRESPLYSERERAALAWTEALTLVAQTGAPDADYEVLKGQFDESEIVHLTLLIGAINLRAPSVLAGAMANRLPEGRDGAIVNIIDQRVWKLTPQYYSYTLTKAALLTATQTMAQALSPRIRVNAVGPGPTLPNPHDGADLMDAEVAGTLLGRKVDASEIAEAVLYLAQARSVTGQMIAVDAGQHLGWRTPDIVG